MIGLDTQDLGTTCSQNSALDNPLHATVVYITHDRGTPPAGLSESPEPESRDLT